MIDFSKLVGFRKGLRPAMPDSLPYYLDRELERIGVITLDLVAAIKNLEARVAALE